MKAKENVISKQRVVMEKQKETHKVLVLNKKNLKNISSLR